MHPPGEWSVRPDRLPRYRFRLAWGVDQGHPDRKSPHFANNDAHHILYNTTTGGLYDNADGAGAGAPTLIAILDGAPTLDSTDLLIV